MDEPTVKYTEEEIKAAIEDSEDKKKSQKQPHEGEVNGYRFAKRNLTDADTVFQRYKRAYNKMGFWYSLVVSPLGRLPVIGYYIQMRAWYWDGYHIALSKVLGVHYHRDATGDEEVIKIKDRDTGEVIYNNQE